MTDDAITQLVELIDLGGSNTTLNVHHIESGVMFDLMQDGRLSELKREERQKSYPYESDPPVFYLVGKTKVEDIDVTLFSDDLPVASGLVEAVSNA